MAGHGVICQALGLEGCKPRPQGLDACLLAISRDLALHPLLGGGATLPVDLEPDLLGGSATVQRTSRTTRRTIRWRSAGWWSPHATTRREMLASRQDRLTVAPRQCPVALALPRGVVLFDCCSRPQLRLPVLLQGAGDQPVFGRDCIVWALRSLGLKTRPLHASLPLAFAPAGFAFAVREGFHRQCHVVRRERLQHHLLDHRVDIGGADLLTARSPHSIALVLPTAPGRCPRARDSAPTAGHHSRRTGRSLQQRRSDPRRS